jgi:CRP/FNR family cyclic AMP-dependent transcriptional regulator
VTCTFLLVSQVTDELKRVPLFSELSKRQLGKLARSCRERIIGSGLTPVREGKRSGVDFFVIVDGEAVVTSGGKQVATLGPGDHFGELALISKGERSATVTATTRLRCLTMTSWDFREFARQNPDVTWKLLQHVVDLLAAEREA